MSRGNETNKLAYIRHVYSGPPKSRKRVQAALKRCYGNSSDKLTRQELWRNKKQRELWRNKKQRERQQSTGYGTAKIDTAHTTQDPHHLYSFSTHHDKPKIKTYSRPITKICYETCSTSSSAVESVIKPETIDNNCPQPDPDIKVYQLTVERTSSDNLSGLSGYQILEDMPGTSQNVEDSPQSENEIKVFCPKCDTEVSHTAEGIQEDQTKILIAKVYHYFEREYEELKTIYGDLDTFRSKFLQRTALATGVSETTVLQILKEEQGWNADQPRDPPEKRRRACKRSRETDRAQTLVVKEEPSVYYNEEPEIYVPAAVKVEPSDVELDKEQAATDPISVDVKTEPRSDVVDKSRYGVFGDTEIKVVEIEIHEKGVS